MLATTWAPKTRRASEEDNPEHTGRRVLEKPRWPSLGNPGSVKPVATRLRYWTVIAAAGSPSSARHGQFGGEPSRFELTLRDVLVAAVPTQYRVRGTHESVGSAPARFITALVERKSTASIAAGEHLDWARGRVSGAGLCR